MARINAETQIQSILLELIVIIAVARACAWIAKRLGQAEVVGEMIAGILLGPTLFGYLAPETFAYVFPPSSAALFSALANIGLVLLMFQIGLDVKLEIAAAAKRTVVLVSTCSVIVPFAVGLGASVAFYQGLPEPRPDQTSFAMIFGVSMSITALPVLGRIFTETGFADTRAGAIAISAAAIEDVIGWTLLGATTLMVAGELSADWIAWHALGVAAVVVGAAYVARPLLHRYFEAHLARHQRLKHTGISLVLILVFGCAIITSKLGLHVLIGGFVLGAALHQNEPFVREWKTRMGPMVTTLFLPIFFTFTGLRTDVGTIAQGDIPQCIAIVLLAFAVKFGGAYLGATLAREPRSIAYILGISMNTRGLMELVALNIGYELGILSRALFSQLVYMAVATTMMTTPLVRRYMRREGLTVSNSTGVM